MKITYTTRLDDNLIEAIKIQAAKERVQVCTLIESAIMLYLLKKEKEAGAKA